MSSTPLYTRATRPRTSLVEKYQPDSLMHFVGNHPSYERLRDFSRAPCSTGFIFHGAPGNGKTTAAKALFRDLNRRSDGTAPDVDRAMDFVVFKPGSLTVEDFDKSVEPHFRYSPWVGADAWRVLVFEEVSKFSEEVQARLNVLLDPAALPPRTVVIFTTNHPEKWEGRASLWNQRLEALEFPSDASETVEFCQDLARAVWVAETGEDPESCPVDASLLVDPKSKRLTPRSVLLALDPIIARMQADVSPGSFSLASDRAESPHNPLLWVAEKAENARARQSSTVVEPTRPTPTSLARPNRSDARIKPTRELRPSRRESTQAKRQAVLSVLSTASPTSSLRAVAQAAGTSFEFARKIARETCHALATIVD
jgi:hypothetical protein